MILSASGTPSGGSYRWYTGPSGANQISGQTGSSFTTPSLSATTDYYVSVFTGDGCESSRVKVTATVNPLPTATLTSSDADNAICAGESITFTAGEVAGATYEFFVGGGSIGAPSANRTFTTTTLTNGQQVSARVTLGTCSVTSLVIITAVTPRPTTAAAGNDQTVNGTSTTLTGNTPSVGTGAWSIVGATGAGNTASGNIADASNPQSGFSGLPGTTYSLRWTISNGICAASTDEVSIRFNQISTTTTLANATATYGNASVNLVATVTPAAATGSVEFLVNNVAVGTAALSAGTATFAYDLAGVNADTYTTQAKYAGSGPYTASNSGNGTLAVSPKALSIGITASDKDYDGTATASVSASITGGLENGDQVTVAATNGRFADKHVGTNKTVTATVALTGDDAGNYSLTSNTASATASITARALAVNLTAQDKVYDGTAIAVVSVSIASELVVGDEVTVSASKGSFADRNAGQNKQVTALIGKSGGDAGNY
ncbi:MAG: Ig-like domain repeat protein, partial [Cytophagales bacterium]|nr:Ig-like domain repeat protein [Cytophagales bacterium]